MYNHVNAHCFDEGNIQISIHCIVDAENCPNQNSIQTVMQHFGNCRQKLS